MATLTVTFTGTTPAPIGGYVVKYWPVGRIEDGREVGWGRATGCGCGQ